MALQVIGVQTLDNESRCCYYDSIMQYTRLGNGRSILYLLLLRCVFHAESQDYVHFYSTEENDDDRENEDVNYE